MWRIQRTHIMLFFLESWQWREVVELFCRAGSEEKQKHDRWIQPAIFISNPCLNLGLLLLPWLPARRCMSLSLVLELLHVWMSVWSGMSFVLPGLVWYELSGLVWSEFCLFVWVWSGMCCCVGAVLGGEGKPHMNSIQFLSNRSERKGFNPRRYPPTPFSILSWQANFCTCKISFHWFSILAGKLICVHVRSLFFSLMAGKAGQGKFLSM